MSSMNNAKVLSNSLLKKLKDKYIITYFPDDDTIEVTCTDCARVTIHDTNGFAINAKKFHRRISFNKKSIDLWKELLKDKTTEHITLFDVRNALVMLNAMYQAPTKERILELINNNFNVIRKLK